MITDDRFARGETRYVRDLFSPKQNQARLGATPRHVLVLALRHGVVLISIGIPTGLLLPAALTRSLSGMLFELTPLDIRTYAVVAVSFGAVSLVASYVPARLATRADPLVALRYE